ncbi:hypothetical protein PMIN02_011676 [Paraphaeosphaeria minitans]
MWSFTAYGSILALFSLSLSAASANDQRTSDSSGDTYDYRPGSQIPASRPPPGGNWLGFGADVYNNHWAGSDSLINIASVKTLNTVCQKKYEPGLSAAPLIEDGVAYYNTFGGLLVALDYENCKEKWTLNVTDLILRVKGNSDGVLATGGALASRSTPVADGVYCTSVHLQEPWLLLWTSARASSLTHLRSATTRWQS